MGKAMSFRLKEYKTEQTTSLSDFIGKPVIIQFWVAWCPDCMRELPLLDQFHKSMTTEEIIILSINVTGREGSFEQRDEFIEKNNITIPVLLDEGTKIYDQFRCQSVPTTILLDEHHKVQSRYTDQDSFQDILTGIPRLLSH
ncbi:TlpA disulfide reductase family protein [Pseudalkalibacillus salsuginis]|uniref:TlpA disulfide reductase family protein n=1 Tax=Pseudalkalibacillus salsuginis TaxID=2910972 RepID=UPI001F24FBF8|nr:TlpA disulfide reductase family protein [Pseudalkalibacillus salsuginis]MCF6410398.1 TlpA family protein disulfide reductase [Pseudalkalibacillus salsuginis]